VWKLIEHDVLRDLCGLSGTSLTDEDEDLSRVVLFEEFLPKIEDKK
jgi:hypothetical protein